MVTSPAPDASTPPPETARTGSATTDAVPPATSAPVEPVPDEPRSLVRTAKSWWCAFVSGLG